MKKCKVVNLNTDDYDVYIGRPSKWGNPYLIGKDGSRQEVIEKYKKRLLLNKKLLNDLHELEGKVLGCWCKPKPCHGDILVEFVNNKNNLIF